MRFYSDLLSALLLLARLDLLGEKRLANQSEPLVRSTEEEEEAVFNLSSLLPPLPSNATLTSGGADEGGLQIK